MRLSAQDCFVGLLFGLTQLVENFKTSSKQASLTAAPKSCQLDNSFSLRGQRRNRAFLQMPLDEVNLRAISFLRWPTFGSRNLATRHTAFWNSTSCLRAASRWRVHVLARSELGRSTRWGTAFDGERKDHRYYELVEDTLTPGFEYRYFALRIRGARFWRSSPFFSYNRICWLA